MRLWSPAEHDRGLVGFTKWLLTAPLLLFDLAMFVRQHRVAVFHFHYPLSSVFPIALLRCLRVFRGALLVTFHGLDLAPVVGASRIRRVQWRFILRWTTAVTACSEAFAQDVRAALRELGGPVQAVQNGLDIAHLHEAVDRTHPLPDDILKRDYILSIATFERKKGLDILLRAFAEVRLRHPGVALVLVGRSAAAATELRELAHTLGIAADVFFLPDLPHARVGLLLERARVFCLPSRAEPFGIVLLEAGAYRLPVVASRVGGIPEIVVDGETGLLVPPEDVTALAAALDKVLSDVTLASVLGGNMYSRVAAQFSWDRTYKMYRGLIPGGDGGNQTLSLVSTSKGPS
jgi:glycosyltransferase involved in cell wall biosynthesis